MILRQRILRLEDSLLEVLSPDDSLLEKIPVDGKFFAG
jgi:hypothetical protein